MVGFNTQELFKEICTNRKHRITKIEFENWIKLQQADPNINSNVVFNYINHGKPRENILSLEDFVDFFNSQSANKDENNTSIEYHNYLEK